MDGVPSPKAITRVTTSPLRPRVNSAFEYHSLHKHPRDAILRNLKIYEPQCYVGDPVHKKVARAHNPAFS